MLLSSYKWGLQQGSSAMFYKNIVDQFCPRILSFSVVCLMTVIFSGIFSGRVSAQNSQLEACLNFDRVACNDVLRVEPNNLTALFMRGLSAELAGDHIAALKDFEATVQAEPRHFGAQLWRQITALSVNENRADALKAYLGDAKQLPDWPRVLAELYIGEAQADAVLKLAEDQPKAARAEAICAAQYHIGRQAYLKGDQNTALSHYRKALATNATHVFEYQAAELAVKNMN